MSEQAPHPERLVRREERRADDGRRLVYYTFEPEGEPEPPAQEP